MKTKKRIGIYCKTFDKIPFDIINKIIILINQKGGCVSIYKPLLEMLITHIDKNITYSTFANETELANNADVIFSIGGDGTFLGTVPFVCNNNIPVLGINTGRLGFLANVSSIEIEEAINDWFKNNYNFETKTLLQISGNKLPFKTNENYALNDITIRRGENASMLSFYVEIDGVFLNTYWADGIIISTATGSTAYSMSCGGPILAPGTKAFIITPIASHALTVRPLVISDSSEIKVKITGRECNYSLGIDSKSFSLNSSSELIINKASKEIKVVCLKKHSFYNTIREKLLWGFDKRN